MPKIIHVRALPNWELAIEFDDGTAGTISLADRLFGPVFEPLRDPDFFCRFGWMGLNRFVGQTAPTWLQTRFIGSL